LKVLLVWPWNKFSNFTEKYYYKSKYLSSSRNNNHQRWKER